MLLEAQQCAQRTQQESFVYSEEIPVVTSKANTYYFGGTGVSVLAPFLMEFVSLLLSMYL